MCFSNVKVFSQNCFHYILKTIKLLFIFQFYGYLSQQQNMMQDYIRTSTYQRAILANLDDFKDKVR